MVLISGTLGLLSFQNINTMVFSSPLMIITPADAHQTVQARGFFSQSTNSLRIQKLQWNERTYRVKNFPTLFQNSEDDWSRLRLLQTCLWIVGALKWPMAVSAAAWELPVTHFPPNKGFVHLECSYGGAGWLNSLRLNIEDSSESPGGVQRSQPRHGHGGRVGHQVWLAADQKSRALVWDGFMQEG